MREEELTYDALIKRIRFRGENQVELFKRGQCICGSADKNLKLYITKYSGLFLYCDLCVDRAIEEGAIRELTTKEYFVVSII